MTDMHTLQLGEALEDIIDYRGKTPPKTTQGIPVISAKCVKRGRLIEPIEQKIDPNYYPIWMTRGLPQAGDVIMTTEGPLGEVAQLDKKTSCYALGQRVVCMRGKKGLLCNIYLKFLLMSSFQQDVLNSYATGTTVAGISQKALLTVPITLPSYEQQIGIGTLLGALDDKIDLNRRMNETLEAMARAIFKDWFVDFGPTRAKMEGREPYLAREIWDLFPGALDAEGKPEGWELGRLTDVVELNPSASLKKGSPAPYLDMAALPTAGPTPQPPAIREFSSGMRFRNGDTLLARITPCLENGKTAFVQCLEADAVGWGSTEFIVLRPIPPVPKPYAYILAREPHFRRCAIQSMTGTSGRQRARADAIGDYPVVMPKDDGIWFAFGSLVDPLFTQIAANAAESETLAQTLDLLLPKLMSGEIRVKEAEKVVEAAL